MDPITNSINEFTSPSQQTSRKSSISFSIGSPSLDNLNLGMPSPDSIDSNLDPNYWSSSWSNEKCWLQTNRYVEVVKQIELGYHLVIQGLSKHQVYLILILCNQLDVVNQSDASKQVWELIVSDIGDLKHFNEFDRTTYKEIYRTTLQFKSELISANQIGFGEQV